MTTTTTRALDRIIRALTAYSTHTAETYTTVWGPRTQRTHRTAEDVALHA